MGTSSTLQLNGTPGLQSFGTAFPFDVAIKNQFQGQNLPVIYIVDQSVADPTSLQVQIAITPVHAQEYAFGGFAFTSPASPSMPASGALPPVLVPTNSPFVPGSVQYNISIAFRPGTLRDSVAAGFSTLLYAALNQALPGTGIAVNGPFLRSADNASVWYCAFADDVPLGSGLSFTLAGISAAPGAGSRSTEIEIGFGNLFRDAAGNSLSFERTTFVDIINHQGQAYAPLYFGVMGKNVILNDAVGQKMKIYFETINRAPVTFGPDTAVEFRFPYAAPASVLMHFGKDTEVGGYKLDSVDVQSDTENDADSSVTISGPTDDPPSSSQTITAAFGSTGSVANEAYTQVTSDIALHQANAATSASLLASGSGPQATALGLWNNDLASRNALISNANSYIHSLGPTSGEELFGAQGMLFVFCNGSYPISNEQVVACGMDYVNRPFSVAYWNECYKNFLSCLNTYGEPLPTSPAAVTSDWATAPWSDAAFTQWVTSNFTTLVNYILGQWETNPNSQGGAASFSPNLYVNGTPLPQVLAPCQGLYDYFYTAYLLANKVTVESAFLLNAEAEATPAAWSAAAAAAQAAFPAASANLLAEEASGVSYPYNAANPWYDANFSSYVFGNFPALIAGLTGNAATPVSTAAVSNPTVGVSYSGVVPCRALFDYFYAQYQLSILLPMSKTTPQEIPTYSAPISCVFNFSQILTSGTDGTVMLGVTVRNLPGYWDTSFQVPLVKETSELNGVLQLGLASTNGHASNGSRIEFLSAGPGVVSIEENWGLNLWGDPKHPVNVHADLYVNGTQLTASDAALKEAIEPLPDEVLHALTNLKPSTFRFKGQGENARRSLGFIAQQVKEVLPELVEERQGRSFVSYQELGVLAIAAIQRQEEVIGELRRRIEQLESGRAK